MAADDQQREIVLGNKQLLSIFFIVVALMGVAFTLGYIIGRNGSVSAATLGSPTGSSRTPPAASSPAPVAASDAPPDDAPARTPTPTPVPIPAREKPAPHVETPAVKKTPEPSVEAPEPGKQIAGATYLQVAALKRQDAEHIVKVLRDRHFAALLGESPKEGYFRVLVGPFPNMQALAESKAKLHAAGFESIVAR